MVNVNRRELLQGGAGLAIGLGLAGCGTGNSSGGDKKATEKPIKKKVDGDLVYFNYSEYVDPKLVKGFEKKYGVKVRESYFDSMSAMTAKLRAGIAYDLIFPSSEYVQRLLAGNLLRRIDRDQIKNVDSVYSQFADPWYDKGGEHSTPYGMYATGLGYRADKVKDMTGSWRDLGNADSQDRSFLLDDYQEAIGMANLVNGYELNETDPQKLEKSKDYLIDLKPKLRGISTDTITNMVSGNAWIQHLWNGDIVNIRYQVDNPEDYKFQKCREGHPGRQRQLLHPGQRQASGDRTAVHRVDAPARARGAERGVDRVPDALRRRSDGGLRGSREGRPSHQRDGRGPREGPAVREPEGRGPAGLGRGVDGVQGLLGRRSRGTP